jgi:hypothetical protein
MLSAESAVLVHLKSVGRVLFVLHRVVVALLAFRAGQSDFDSHNGTSIINVPPSFAFRRSVFAPKSGRKKRTLQKEVYTQYHTGFNLSSTFFCGVSAADMLYRAGLRGTK